MSKLRQIQVFLCEVLDKRYPGEVISSLTVETTSSQKARRSLKRRIFLREGQELRITSIKRYKECDWGIF